MQHNAFAASHWLAGVYLRLGLMVAPLLLAVLAGCGQAPKTTNTFERPITFSQLPYGVHVGDRIDWHFQVQNGGDARLVDLSLHLFIAFNNDPNAGDSPEQAVPDMGAGSVRELVISSPYRGVGDYSGVAEIWQSGFTAARTNIWFEVCQVC